MIILNKENFKKEVFQEDILTIVYFWSPDCQFCRMMGPYVDEIEEKYADKYKFCKVNVSKDPESIIACMYNVDTTPTLLMLDCGDVVAKAVGVLMPNDIIAELDLDEKNLPTEEHEANIE